MAVLRAEVMRCEHTVEVDSGYQEDLGRVLEEMRSQYEVAIVKNTREIELWYKNKVRA